MDLQICMGVGDAVTQSTSKPYAKDARRIEATANLPDSPISTRNSEFKSGKNYADPTHQNQSFKPIRSSKKPHEESISDRNWQKNQKFFGTENAKNEPLVTANFYQKSASSIDTQALPISDRNYKKTNKTSKRVDQVGTLSTVSKGLFQSEPTDLHPSSDPQLHAAVKRIAQATAEAIKEVSDRNSQKKSKFSKKKSREISDRNQSQKQPLSQHDEKRFDGYSDKEIVGRTTFFQPSDKASARNDEQVLRFLQHLHGKRDLTQTDGQYVVLAHNRAEANPALIHDIKSEHYNPHWKELRSRQTLQDLVPYISGNNTMYVSVNGFSKSKRRKVNLQSLNALFVDCDTYHAHPYYQRQWQQCKTHVERKELAMQICEKAQVPAPTMVVYSGAGLYLLWAFDQPVQLTRSSSGDLDERSEAALEQWSHAQKALNTVFKNSMGADLQARDECRVLRVPGSYHCKRTPTMAEILYESRAGYRSDLLMLLLIQHAAVLGSKEAFEFTQHGDAQRNIEQQAKPKNNPQFLSEIAKNKVCTSSSTATRAATPCVSNADATIGFNRHQANILELIAFSERHKPNQLKHGTIRSLYWSRFSDLVRLCEMRGDIPSGTRDLFLFWMLVCLCHAGVINRATYDLHAKTLANAFPNARDFKPLQDGTMLPVLHRMTDTLNKQVVHYKGSAYVPLYTPSNDFLIEVFDINPAEMRQLCTIISSKEKASRVQQREEASGTAQARREKQDKIKAVLKLAHEGRTVREIEAQTTIARSTIHRWLKDWAHIHDNFEKSCESRKTAERKAKLAPHTCENTSIKSKPYPARQTWRNPAYYSNAIVQKSFVNQNAESANHWQQKQKQDAATVNQSLDWDIQKKAKELLMKSLQNLRQEVRIQRFKTLARIQKPDKEIRPKVPIEAPLV